MMKKEQFNIFLLMDDNYVYYSLPFMYSLIKNNSAWAEIVFHIASDNLSKEYRTFLSNFSKENGTETIIYEVDTSIFKTLKHSVRYPALLYYKLIPHVILPKNIDRAIFFDTDMICTHSLEDLYHTELYDNYFAMCYGIISFKKLINGITEGVEANYHNSGMMICNLNKLRNDGISVETYLNYAQDHPQGNLFEEFFLNNYYYGKILSLMPFDYNYNIGGRNLYSEFCLTHNITARMAILHYFPFGNDSPIIKPWDAYEYYYENKLNDKIPQDIFVLYKLWWDYALQLSCNYILDIINKTKQNKLAKSVEALTADRNKWQNYSTTFKHLIIGNLTDRSETAQRYLSRAFSERGHKKIAIYGDTEITKVLVTVLADTEIEIVYIVEDSSKPIGNIKTIDRNLKNYPNCDVMLVADIYNFKDIKAKLEKMKVPFPFYNAAEFIQSLPAADGDGIDKIKEKIRNLNDRIVFEREEKERLDIQLSASAKREAELAEKVGTLTKRDTVSQEKIKSLSGDIKQLTATNRRVAEERDSCMGELESVKNSLSFRLGRAITFIPRKIRDAFKKSKK